jgi:hypothetical protein
MNLLLLAGIACNNDAEWDTLPDAVYGLSNTDDDDGNGSVDWDDDLPEGEDDLASLVIPKSLLEGLGKGDSLRLALQSDGIRVYEDGELRMNSAGDNIKLSGTQDIHLEIEFSDFMQQGSLKLSRAGKTPKSHIYSLISSPLLINHHLQPAEQAYSMLYSGNGGNQDFITGFERVLGEQFTSYNLNEYQYDVWLQDEIEFGLSYTDEHRMDLVIDSIRNRGLDDLPENELEGPNMAVRTWGSGMATSQDSFGNLEASPPVTVDGVHYPFGRIYYGKWRDEEVHQSLRTFLDDQSLQAPFELDITWLCVGHVDEFLSFIPDPTAPNGFRMLITDTVLGYEFLESLENISLPKYTEKGYSSIDDILQDNALRSLNEDLQRDYLDPNLEILTRELGLVEEEIIRIPMLFEEAPQCSIYTATFMPGTVNMLVYTHEGGESADLLMPDPFFRANAHNQSTDVWIEHIESLLPDSVTPHWIDDWEWYHMALGEVHCGSNTKRSPAANWWEDGLHLLPEGE